MLRCGYPYKWPCSTEYNPDYFSRDHMEQLHCREYNAQYIADYNAKYDAEIVTKLYNRQYSLE
jgi:hypothetical protein